MEGNMAVHAHHHRIIKRSYLTICKGPLKDSMLSSRRWCVLLQDASRGFTRMDFFKDEKTASRGEEPRNSLNVSSIVEAQRATEKKQTFDLLCPGVSHRFQTSSEAEADEWVTAVKNLIVYRKDDLHSSSSSLILSQLNVQHHPNLPTPPEQVFTSTPIPVAPERRPVLQATSTLMEANPQHPFPSPNSSSDCSSVHSTSTGSGEGQHHSVLVAEGAPEQRLANGRYRVHIKDCEQLVSGDYELAVEEDYLKLYHPGQKPTHQMNAQTAFLHLTTVITTIIHQLIVTWNSLNDVLIASWHIGTLRRYGVNKICFTIDVGRHGPTGEGKFFFFTGLSSLIYSEVHRIAQRIDALSKGAMLSQWSTSPTKKDSDSLSAITSVSACSPSAGYSRLNHHLTSAFIPPSSTGHTYGTLSHDGNFSSNTGIDGMHNKWGGSQVGYSTYHPNLLQPMTPAVSHTLPCVRSTSSGGYLTRHHSSLSESPETTQPSHHPQLGDSNAVLVEEEGPPPLPPKPQRSMSADDSGALYTNCRVLPVPPRARTTQETADTLL